MPFCKKKIILKILLSYLIFCAAPQKIYAQFIQNNNPQTIEIISTDLLEIAKNNDQEIRKLVGNVQLVQGNVTMKCDSAYLFANQNNVQAFGKIEIQQGDSVTIKARNLFYNGNKKTATLTQKVFLTDKRSDIYADSLTYIVQTRKAFLRKNVHLTDHKIDAYAQELDYNVNSKHVELRKNTKLTDKETTITAPNMTYNINSQEGTYTGYGTLTNKNTTLNSETALYHGKTQLVDFDQNVKLNTPQYQVNTPYLQYNLQTETANFKGATTIINEGNTIQAQKGEFDARNNRLTLNERTTMQRADNQQVTANTFYYDKITGMGKATGNVIWNDTKQNTTLKSQAANFNDKTKTIEAFGKVLLSKVSNKGDTLYLTADTLISKPANNQINTNNTANKNDTAKVFLAYRHVKILKNDLQAVCDSLIFSEKDSVFNLFKNPVVWSENYQLYADTIILHLKNNQPHQIHLLQNAYMANFLEHPNMYNQLKGKYIHAFFENGSPQVLHVKNGAESIYYAQDDSITFLGVNRATAAEINLFFKQKKLDKISFINKPDATFFPIQQIDPKKFMLKGFEWKATRRPMHVRSLWQ